ncbi:methyl-CpG-binding domain protein 2-like isoform X2 [Prinia subflava]|uniref:methyl-CpG-binding domain protein 2-like isoform X2 n=1 Tax=Prinia subflava TaxID=208062 RepID=UPI002FDF204F
MGTLQTLRMRGGRYALSAAALWAQPGLQLRALRALPAAPPAPGPGHGAGPGQRRGRAGRGRGALGRGRSRLCSRQDPRPLCRERRRGAGAAMAEPGERRGRAGDSGGDCGGLGGGGGSRAQEEEEEEWEDGDSGHQRLGEAQLQVVL